MEWEKLLSTETLVKRELEDESWERYPINEFEKDYKGIISSAAFRRLQDKTQVFPLDKSDFVRTRLTHSIEVSSIGKQLGIMLTKDKDRRYGIKYFKEHLDEAEAVQSILSCAGLLHDLGNPPFGHFGEVVIGDWFNEQMEKEEFVFDGKRIKDLLSLQMRKDLTGFEGNAQALRILSKIYHTPSGNDINLSFGIINTLVKYPTSSLGRDSNNSDIRKHKMGYYVSEAETFDMICSETGTKLSEGNYVRHPLTFLLEAADDIAYATSDLEDALKKDMFTVEQFIAYYKNELKGFGLSEDDKKRKKSEELISTLESMLDNLPNSRERDTVAFQKWLHYTKGWLMYVVAYSFAKNYDEIMEGVYKYDLFQEGFHTYTIKILKGAMREFVFNSDDILKLELSAKKIIESLLNDFIYAVIEWDCDNNGKERRSVKKSNLKFINIISENYKNDYENAVKDITDPGERLYHRFLMVTDYISGMTDSFAKNLYQELNGIR